jgi:serine/threonine-protein kinase
MAQPVAADLVATQAMSADALPGTMFGPYRVERKIAQGGMGAVYLATDTRLGRQVALKMVSATEHTPEASARFLREAKSAAALAHPNIAVIHDFGATGGRPWLVMEYVPGTPLRSRLLAGALDPGSFERYAAQIADALAHGHGRLIVHGDVKPENVIIAGDDTVKMVDFGLARPILDAAHPGNTITQPGTFLGTLGYAAPELFASSPPSTRSDVYSAGVLLYEMACGEHVFPGLSGPALVAAVVSDQRPKVRDRNPAVSASVAAVIERCIARDPVARFRDAGELAAALRRAAAGEATQGLESPPPSLAIVDFINLAGATTGDWLGTGIAETLSADLGRLKTVRVSSRGRVQGAVQRFGHPETHAGAASGLGRELEARWIVTGGYQQIGDRVRITPKLIDALSGDVLTTAKIDGRWEDLFELQDRVATTLLDALTVRFGTTDRQKIALPETPNMEAYENYARGRQELYRMQGRSLTAAIGHFERAVALDPNYALAWSGLGTSHALRFITSINRDDIVRASECLERAIQLDPELGEPYAWVSMIRLRQNDIEGAFAAGEKAIELQPDLAEGHYFYGGLYYMGVEIGSRDMQRGPRLLAEAIRLQPKHHAAWMVAGGLAMFLGQYEPAIALLARAAEMEREPDLHYRFVGARTLLGFAFTRAQQWDRARAAHLGALEFLATTDNVYTRTFQILSASGLGEIELRQNNPAAASAHFRHARRLVKEAPHMLGAHRLLMRAVAGLGAAYAASGDLDRARELRGEAAELLESIVGRFPTMVFECSVPQLCLTLAVLDVRLRDLDNAASLIVRAVEFGWRDWRWLLADPEFEQVRSLPAFRAALERLQAAPPIEIPLPPQLRSASDQSSAGNA